MNKTLNKKINFLETFSQSKKFLINNFLLKNLFQIALLNKEIILCKFKVNKLNDIIIVYAESFFRTAKMIKYKRLLKKKKLLIFNNINI